jgi:quercetin dioxygenase-like cupin family protein
MEQKEEGKLGLGVNNLAGLVNYDDNSIVSRTLIDKEAGTITIFAFDNGQGLSEHTAPYDAFVYILEGKADIVISRSENKLKAGDMIIIPANKPHEIKAEERFKMLLVMIRS